MFCPNCGAEFKSGIAECNDCLVPLVDQPPETPENATSVVKQVGWTIGILVVYFAMPYIPLPILNHGTFDGLDGFYLFKLGSIQSLGIVPFIIGFFLIEFFSLLTPWGRRAREDGSRGRRKLNRWAVRCSLVVCVVQASVVTSSLAGFTMLNGERLVAFPGIYARLLGIASISAGSVAAFVLCNVITVRGIGNGFCLVVTIESLRLAAYNFQLLRNEGGSNESAIAVLIQILVIGAAFAALLRHQNTYSLADAAHRSILSRLPALPQSILPIAAAYWLLSLPTALIVFRRQTSEQEVIGPIAYLVGLAVAVPVLSYVTLHLFSSRVRIEHNLPNVVPAEDFSALLSRRFWLTTAAMTLAVIFSNVMDVFLYPGYFVLGVVQIALIVAVIMDLFDEWQFHRRNPDAEVLVELDNVHLACLVETNLTERGVACRVKALHFRSLFFFLGPIFKMNVLVAGDRLDEAREWLDSLDPRIT